MWEYIWEKVLLDKMYGYIVQAAVCVELLQIHMEDLLFFSAIMDSTNRKRLTGIT